jgi:hypothetical protein
MRYFYALSSNVAGGYRFDLQMKPTGVCLDVNKRYKALVDWSAETPLISFAETYEKLKYPYPQNEELCTYMNVSCWTILGLLENAFDSHEDIDVAFIDPDDAL